MTISDRLSTDELEIKFQERIAELEKANRVLRAEIRDANVLHTLSTRYIAGIDSHSICQEIVDAAIAITKADKGNIQVLDPSTGKLKIVAHRGFDLPLLKFFEDVDAGEAAACGTAMKRLERVVIEDVTQSPIFIGSDALAVLLNEGVLGVQSTPLVSRSGKLLGILSTHFSQTCTLSEHELMLIDILARQAADMIEQVKTEKELKESEERLRLLGDNLPDSALYQYVHELDGSVRFLYCSAGIEKLNSVSIQDVLQDSSTLHRQLPPEYFEQLVENEARRHASYLILIWMFRCSFPMASCAGCDYTPVHAGCRMAERFGMACKQMLPSASLLKKKYYS